MGELERQLANLIRPSKFDGLPGTWRSFKGDLLNFIEFFDPSLAGALEGLNPRSTVPEILGTEANYEAIVKSARWLYSLLSGLCKDGLARSFCVLSTGGVKRNGFETYWKLLQEYEPLTASRRVALYGQVINPTFHSDMDDETWRTSFTSWEVLVEDLRGLVLPALVDPNLLVAVL